MRPSVWLLCLTVLTMMAGVGTSVAGDCPATVNLTVPAGGSVPITCAYNYGFLEVNQIQSYSSTYGHVSVISGEVYAPAYFNTSGAGQTDSFYLTDASIGSGIGDPNAQVHIIVTIQASTSPITVTPSTPPVPAIGVPYSQQLSASGGVGAYTYTITGGSLPPGLTMSATGLISGTPTGADSYNFTVHVTDQATPTANTLDKTYSVIIQAPNLDLSPDNPPAGAINQPYSQQFSVSGGTAPYTYSVQVGQGSPPPGLTLNSTGLLSGTPTATGNFKFSLKYQDSTTFSGGGQAFAAQDVTVTINNATVPGAPTSASATAGNAQATVTFSAPASNGGAPITGYTVTSSPAGGVDANAGSTALNHTITGLTNGAVYTFTVTATNGVGTGPASAASIAVTPKGGQTITFNNPDQQNFGTSPTLTATASSNLTPTFTSSTTGVCTITSGGTLTFLSVGTCTINADQAGSAAYTPAPTVTQSFTVAATVPGAPINVAAASAGAGAATVTFAAPANTGGAAIIGYTVTSIPAGGVDANAGSTALSHTITGLANGTAYTFTVTATNSVGTGPASAASNSVTLLGTITPPTYPTIVQGNASPSLTITASAAGPVSITPSGAGLTFNPATISFSGSASQTFTVSAASNAGPGPVAISYVLTGSAASAYVTPPTGSITVQVPAPTAANKSVSTPYNTAASIDLSGSITGSGITAVTIGTAPTHGTLSVSSETVTYTPASTFYGGTDSFTYTATNAGGTSGQATVTVTVGNPPAPTVAAKSVSTPYNTAVSIDLTSSITGAGITAVTIGTAPTHGMVSVSGETVTYTPATTFYGGTDTFTYTATNAGGTSTPATVTISVGNPPAPTVANKAVLTPYNTTASIDLSGSITGPGITAVTIGTAPTHGTVSVSGETVIYTPASTYYGGTDSFTYTATNAGGTSAQATVTVTVSAPAAPTVADKPVSTPYNMVASIDLSGSITGAGITAVTIGTAPIHGTVSVSGQTVTYTPASTYYGGTDSFTYTATNAGGTSAQATVTVTVSAPAAPTVADKPVSTPYNTAANIDLTGSITGAGITAVTIGTVPTHGTVSVSGETVTYTPAPTFYGGTDTFTYTATNAGGTSTPATVTVAVGTPPIPTVADKSVSTSYNTVASIDLSGSVSGVGITSLTIGTVPTHGTVSVSGETATYTPASTFYGGADSFTYTATNAGGTSAPATVTVTVAAPPPPTATAKSATTPYNTAASIDLSGSITGAGITAVTIGTAPAHGTVSVSGETATYTPASTYYGGTDSFTYTATNAGGTSAPATVTITVAAPPPPTITTASLPNATGGVAYSQTIAAASGVAPYSFTSPNGSVPAGLSLSTSGVLSGAPTATGNFSILVRVTDTSNQTSDKTLALAVSVPAPVARDLSVDLLAGTTGTVNLTAGATGGPFTAAAIVAAPAPADGTASIGGSNGAYELAFASSATASGAVAISYSLSNRWGVSAPATVTFRVKARPDPSKDQEVIGLINAQADSARRFAAAQIRNFNGRLEQLHDEGERRANSLDIQVGMTKPNDTGEPLGYTEDDPRADRSSASFGFPTSRFPTSASSTAGSRDKSRAHESETASPMAFWAGGFVNFGQRDNGAIDLKQTLAGVSGGVDYRFSPHFVGGVGFGYGRDAVDVGQNGTQSNGQALSVVAYGSYNPLANVFLDGLVGYSRLDFDSHRFVTDTGDFADGQRGGQQVFGSLTAAYEYRKDGWLLSPYGRLDASRARLDAFTEAGAGSYNLTFGAQSLSTVSGVLGLRAEYAMPMSWGVLTRRARLEYTHDFAGSSRASLGYADLSNGLPYGFDVDAFSRDSLGIGLGFDMNFDNGWMLGFDYATALGTDGNAQDHTVAVKVGARW